MTISEKHHKKIEHKFVNYCNKWEKKHSNLNKLYHNKFKQ